MGDECRSNNSSRNTIKAVEMIKPCDINANLPKGTLLISSDAVQQQRTQEELASVVVAAENLLCDQHLQDTGNRSVINKPHCNSTASALVNVKTCVDIRTATDPVTNCNTDTEGNGKRLAYRIDLQKQQNWGELVSANEYTEVLELGNDNITCTCLHGNDAESTSHKGCCSNKVDSNHKCVASKEGTDRKESNNTNNNNYSNSSGAKDSWDRVVSECHCGKYNNEDCIKDTQVYTRKETGSSTPPHLRELKSSSCCGSVTCADKQSSSPPGGIKWDENGGSGNNPSCKHPTEECQPNGLTGSPPLLVRRGNSDSIALEVASQGFSSSVLNGVVSVTEVIPFNSSRHSNGGIVSRETDIGDNAAAAITTTISTEKDEGGGSSVVLKRNCNNGGRCHANHILLYEEKSRKDKDGAADDCNGNHCLRNSSPALLDRVSTSSTYNGTTGKATVQISNDENKDIQCYESKKPSPIPLQGVSLSGGSEEKCVQCGCSNNWSNNKSAAPLGLSNGSPEQGEQSSQVTCEGNSAERKLTPIKGHVCARITYSDTEANTVSETVGEKDKPARQQRGQGATHVIREKDRRESGNNTAEHCCGCISCDNHISQHFAAERNGGSASSRSRASTKRTLLRTQWAYVNSTAQIEKDGLNTVVQSSSYHCQCSCGYRNNSNNDIIKNNKAGDSSHVTDLAQTPSCCGECIDASELDFPHLSNISSSNKNLLPTNITINAASNERSNAVPNDINNTSTEKSPSALDNDCLFSGEETRKRNLMSNDCSHGLETRDKNEKRDKFSSHKGPGNNLDYTTGDCQRVINLNGDSFPATVAAENYCPHVGSGAGGSDKTTGQEKKEKENEGGSSDYSSHSRDEDYDDHGDRFSGINGQESHKEEDYSDYSSSDDIDDEKYNNSSSKLCGGVVVKNIEKAEESRLHDTRTQSSKLNGLALPLQSPSKGKKQVEIANFTFSQLSSPEKCNGLELGESLAFVKSRFERDPLFEPEDTSEDFFRKNSFSLRLKSFFGIHSESEDGIQASRVKDSDKLVSLKRGLFSSSQLVKSKSKDSELSGPDSPKTPSEVLTSKLSAFFGLSFDGDDTNNNSISKKTLSKQRFSDFIDLEKESGRKNVFDSLNGDSTWDDSDNEQSKLYLGDIGRKFSLDSQKSTLDRKYEKGFLCQRSFEESFVHVSPWYEDYGTEACVKTEVIYLHNYR